MWHQAGAPIPRPSPEDEGKSEPSGTGTPAHRRQPIREHNPLAPAPAGEPARPNLDDNADNQPNSLVNSVVAKLIGLSAAIGFLFIGCMSEPEPEKSPAQPPIKTANQPVEEVHQVRPVTRIWGENCAGCHGNAGQGGGAGTQTLLTEDLFQQDKDKRFFDAIKFGVPDKGMDKFGETMTDAEIWGLVVHIRELQRDGLRAAGMAPKRNGDTYDGQRHDYKIEDVLTEGLRIPWAVDWLPDGRMLVTNRGGSIVIAKNGKVVAEIEGLPAVVPNGQGGLLDIAVHPNYAQNGWIYLSFSDPAKDNPRAALTKLVRGKLRFNGDKVSFVDQQTIFEAGQENYTTAGQHFGNRIVFDGKGNIFFGIGERGRQELAQQLDKPNGKIYRVREDGSIPPDNPFVKEPGALKSIWSYGHRNPQGLSLDLQGNLWDTEHAPRGGDELNLIEKGANYGWPIVSFGINYNDSPFEVPWPKEGQDINMPAYRWLPSTGACGLTVVSGDKFPQWKGDLIAGGLVGQNVDRIRVKDGQMVEREELIYGLGRVRDVMTGPDGFIYVVFNQPDKVARLVPVK